MSSACKSCLQLAAARCALKMFPGNFAAMASAIAALAFIILVLVSTRVYSFNGKLQGSTVVVSLPGFCASSFSCRTLNLLSSMTLLESTLLLFCCLYYFALFPVIKHGAVQRLCSKLWFRQRV